MFKKENIGEQNCFSAHTNIFGWCFALRKVLPKEKQMNLLTGMCASNARECPTKK